MSENVKKLDIDIRPDFLKYISLAIWSILVILKSVMSSELFQEDLYRMIYFREVVESLGRDCQHWVYHRHYCVHFCVCLEEIIDPSCSQYTVKYWAIWEERWQLWEKKSGEIFVFQPNTVVLDHTVRLQSLQTAY